MRCLAKPFILLAALLFAGCGKGNCERLGERLCSCSGLTSDQCTSQVQSELGSVGHNDGACGTLLGSCTQPAGVNFCEWLNTPAAKEACGLAPECSIGGVVYAPGASNPDNACQVCTPGMPGWSSQPNGTPCGTGLVCTSGSCVTDPSSATTTQ